MKTMTSHLRGPSILFAVAVGFANACGGTGAGVARAIENPEVRYEVSGSSGLAEYISYQADGGQKRAVNAPLPWSTQFTGFGGEVFVISAQGQGTITCKILLDGRTVKEATASGTPAHTVCTQ
jgi:hypothetical protein